MNYGMIPAQLLKARAIDLWAVRNPDRYPQNAKAEIVHIGKSRWIRIIDGKTPSVAFRVSPTTGRLYFVQKPPLDVLSLPRNQTCDSLTD